MVPLHLPPDYTTITPPLHASTVLYLYENTVLSTGTVRYTDSNNVWDTSILRREAEVPRTPTSTRTRTVLVLVVGLRLRQS